MIYTYVFQDITLLHHDGSEFCDRYCTRREDRKNTCGSLSLTCKHIKSELEPILPNMLAEEVEEDHENDVVPDGMGYYPVYGDRCMFGCCKYVLRFCA